MRLIDGDELYQKVVGYNGGAVDKTVAKRLIDQMPTIDAVSRQAAIDGFYEMASDMEHLCTVSDYVSFLESLPSAQPETMYYPQVDGVTPSVIVQPERKNGKWLPDNNNYYEERFICSVCGRSYKVDTCMGKPMWDFCPCGADMRGEQDD